MTDYVYIYNASLYCEACGEKAREELTAEGKAPDDVEDESSYDSGDFPKGPYPVSEADYPHYCDDCGAFLENPLTSEGVDYVRGLIEDAIISGKPGACVAEWQAFYGIDPESPRAVRLARMSDAMREHADEETGELDAYTSVGGYPLFYIVGEGDVCCPTCVNDPSTGVDPWCGNKVTAYDINYECVDLYCDDCNERIESAYAEADVPKDEAR